MTTCLKCVGKARKEKRLGACAAKRLLTPKHCTVCGVAMDRLKRGPRLCTACRDKRIFERSQWELEKIRKKARRLARLKKEWAENPMNDALDMLMKDYGHTREEALRIIGDVQEGLRAYQTMGNAYQTYGFVSKDAQ